MSTPDSQDGPVHPELTGRRVRLRPGDERDAPVLSAILAEPEVACWWGNPDPVSVVAAGPARGRRERAARGRDGGPGHWRDPVSRGE